MALRVLLIFSFVWLQACSTVEGPIHFYPGQIRPGNETIRLQVPAPITVVKIDGRKIDVPSENEGFYEIYLLPGVHRIDFKYELSWGDEVSGILVKSDVVGVESQFFAGKNYELSYPVPTEQEEAYHMALKFEAQLHELESGRRVTSRPIAELNDFRRKNPSVTTDSGSAELNASELPTVETFGMSSPKKNNTDVTVSSGNDANVSVPVDIKVDTATREDAVKRLKFWWLMASKHERKLFREWLKTPAGDTSDK